MLAVLKISQFHPSKVTIATSDDRYSTIMRQHSCRAMDIIFSAYINAYSRKQVTDNLIVTVTYCDNVTHCTAENRAPSYAYILPQALRVL